MVTSISGYGSLDKLSATEPRDHRSCQVCSQRGIVSARVMEGSHLAGLQICSKAADVRNIILTVGLRTGGLFL